MYSASGDFHQACGNAAPFASFSGWMKTTRGYYGHMKSLPISYKPATSGSREALQDL